MDAQSRDGRPTTDDNSPSDHRPAAINSQPSTLKAKERDTAYWAEGVSTLKVSSAPAGAVNINVEGRRVVGPLQGFGPLWQKTYQMRLTGAEVTPTKVIKVWKERFPDFWPAGNRFYGPITGIAPGEVALLNLALPGGMKLSTGVLVLYADDESFTLMTPQGHMFAGWITFSAYKGEECTTVQAQVLMRSNDPIYEIGLRLGGHKQEDRFWDHTLHAVASYFGEDVQVRTQLTCVDSRLQWSQAKNIWHNAALRTALYVATTPLRWVRGRKVGG